MKELHNLAILLGLLYRDEIRFVEEISTLERSYLYPDMEAYIDDFKNPHRFFIARHNLSGHTSVFLEADGDEKFVEFALKKIKLYDKMHLQTGDFEKKILARHLTFFHEYEYLIMSFDRSRFHPIYDKAPTRLTVNLAREDLVDISGGNPDRYREEIRYGVLYGFNIDRSWVALAGTCARSRNYDYIFVETDTAFRRQGLGKALLSYVIRDVLAEGRTPIYALDKANKPSLHLGEQMGFVPYTSMQCMHVGHWTSQRGAFDSDSLPESSFLV